METFSALQAICAGNSPVPGEFPAQRPVTRSFDVYFDLRPNKRPSKQSWGWWFETPSRPLCRHRNGSSISCRQFKILYLILAYVTLCSLMTPFDVKHPWKTLVPVMACRLLDTNPLSGLNEPLRINFNESSIKSSYVSLKKITFESVVCVKWWTLHMSCTMVSLTTVVWRQFSFTCCRWRRGGGGSGRKSVCGRGQILP